MLDTIYKAAVLISIVIIANILTNIGLFERERDFGTISKIVVNLTLPAAIVTKLNGLAFAPVLLQISLLGFLCNWAYLLVSKLMSKDPQEQSFTMININGYNIGNFALPFISYFFTGLPILAVTLFDAGSAFMVNGGNYTMAKRVKEKETNFSFRKLMATMLSSPPIIAYIVMVILSLISMSLPSIFVDIAEIVGGANTFLSMFMIGIALNLKSVPKHARILTKILTVRYGVALGIALLVYHFLPFELAIRQTLTILIFAPVAGIAPVYTRFLGGDLELSGTLNSLSIVVSIIIMSGLLIFWQV